MCNRIGKDGVFYVRSTSTILFYSAGVYLRVPDLFVILKAGLHVRRKHKRKPRVNLDDASTRERNEFLFLVLVSSRFTWGLCLCLCVCLCLRRTCKPVINFPPFYVLDFSLELKERVKGNLWHRRGGDSSSMLQSSFHSLFGFSGKFIM